MPLRMLRKMLSIGRVAEPPVERGAETDGGSSDVSAVLRGSVQLRHVDAGSCNGCEIEIGSAFSPVYDGERYGVRLVASPRHADGLLVTGPVTENMAVALEETYRATPSPKFVVALGDCAMNCGAFADAYAVRGPVSDVVDVDVEIPGCPPDPTAILAALRGVTQR